MSNCSLACALDFFNNFTRFLRLALLKILSVLAATLMAEDLYTGSQEQNQQHAVTSAETETIILGGGCFWCVEAVFETLPGVVRVVSGYAGGTTPNPTYTEVCTGTTGHAEVVKVEFDPRKISLEEILEVFWNTHDPTTPNRQGADVGTQYRSIIVLVQPSQQRSIVEQSLRRTAQRFSSPIVTEIVEEVPFYEAEAYHQDFYRKNPHHPYCRAVIAPKLEKMQQRHFRLPDEKDTQ